ncbi:MAG: hypothetical protein ACI9EW_002267 [Cellvibrionaceae bacterium]|jgi:hypothetical protein
MDSNQQLPLTLKPSYLKLIISFVFAVAFTAGGIWIRSGLPVLGTVTAIFFGLCIIVFGVQFLPGCAYLEMTEDGFTVCNLFQRKTHNWSDVSSFSIRKFPGNSLVIWGYTKAFGDPESERKISDKLTRTEASLPDTYGMSAEDLAELMNKLLRKYK